MNLIFSDVLSFDVAEGFYLLRLCPGREEPESAGHSRQRCH